MPNIWDDPTTDQTDQNIWDTPPPPQVAQASANIWDAPQQSTVPTATVPQQPDALDTAVKTVLRLGVPEQIAKYTPLILPQKLLEMNATSHPQSLEQPNPERALPAQLPALAQGVQQLGENLPYVSPVMAPIAKAASWAIKSSPVSALAKGVDWLQHGQFATALMAHKAIQAYQGNSPDGVLAILKAGKDEYLDPKQRLSFTDVIHNYAPDFAKAHPIAAEVAGFALDVAADPLTYLSGTLSDYVKVAGRSGLKFTEIVPSIARGLPELRGEIAAATEAARAATAAGEVLTTVPRDLAEAAWRKRFGELPVEEATKWIEPKGLKFAGKSIPGLSWRPNILRLQQDALEFNRAAEAATALDKVDAARKALSAKDASEVAADLKNFTAERDKAIGAMDKSNIGPITRDIKPVINMPAETTQYAYRPVESVKDVNSKTWYHGTGQPWQEKVFNPELADTNALYGPGMYKTDNPALASAYAGQADQFGVVYKSKTNASRVLNLGNTPTADELKAWDQVYQSVKREGMQPTFKDFLEKNKRWKITTTDGKIHLVAGDSAEGAAIGLREKLLAEPYTIQRGYVTDTVDKWKVERTPPTNDEIWSGLAGLGQGPAKLNAELGNHFDGMVHQGGVISHGAPHNVFIQLRDFNPEHTYISGKGSPLKTPFSADAAALDAKIAEHRGLLDQITALDSQAEELRKQIAGPFRQPAPLIRPDNVPLDAPFQYLEKVPGLESMFEGVRPGQYLKRAAATAQYFASMTFKKYAYMGDVLGDMMDKFQVRLADARSNAEDFVTKFSTGLNSMERKQIGTKMHEIQTAVETAADEWKAAGKGALPDGEVWKIRQKVLDQTPQGKGLGQMTANSRARFMEWVDEFQKRGEDYKRLGLIQHLQKAYARHEYQNIDPEAMVRYIRYKRSGLPGMFGPGEERFFRTIEEAKAAGFKPELDVAVMLANYVRDGERAIVQKELDKGIFRAYGVQSWSELEKTLGASSKEWKQLNQEVRYLGNPNFSMFAGHDWVQMALRGMDRVTNPFRMGATYGNPAWGMKQGPSNFMQFLLRNSMKVHRGFSPTTHLATMMTLLHDRGILGTLPETPWSRAFSLLGLQPPAGISTAMRESLTLDDLATRLKTNGLISGQHLGSPTKVGKRLDWAIAKANVAEKAAGRLPESIRPAMRGIAAFLGQAADYRNIPPFLEDYGKAYSFINAKLLGHTDKEATRLAFSALYNYDRGLTMVERQIIKRIIPFYSYSRFTAALASSALFERPATIGNLKKGIDHFLSAYGHLKALDRGEDQTPLTEDERMSIKPYRLENPTAFTGREIKDDQVLSVLHSFNNFNPLDTWMTDEPSSYSPDTGPARAIQKIVFAAVVPWLKAAVEIPMNHEFFTGNTIVPETDRLRPNEPPLKKIGKNIDPNVLLSDMVAALGGGTGGTLGAIGGKLFGDQAAALGGAEILKRILGWEEITQPDGSKQVYVSPYKIYAITSMYPMLRRVIRWDDTTKTAAERNYEFWTGVLIQKANLKQEYASQGAMLARERDKRVAEYAKELELSKIRQAQQYGFEPLIDAKKKYDEIMQYIKDYSEIDPNNIR